MTSVQGKTYKKIPRRPYAFSRVGVSEVVALLKNLPGEADEEVLDEVCEWLDAPRRADAPDVTVWLSRSEREAVLDVIDEKDPDERMAAAAVKSFEIALSRADAPERKPYGLPCDVAEDVLTHLKDPSQNSVLEDRAGSCLESSVTPRDLDSSFVLVWLSTDERQTVLDSFSSPDAEQCSRVARYFEKRVGDHRSRLDATFVGERGKAFSRPPRPERPASRGKKISRSRT